MRVRLITMMVSVLVSGEMSVLCATRPASGTSLYAQSAAKSIREAFAACRNSVNLAGPICSQAGNISYLLLDAHTGAVLASDWPYPELPIPVGSLVKPFTALAYGQQHQFHYPIHFCHGTASGCWRPRGHGEVGLESAIANSCNSYFRMLTAHMQAKDVLPIAANFALQPPDTNAPPTALVGLGARWKISPLAIARAYVELLRRRDQPGVHEIIAGMRDSARFGTGEEVNHSLQHTSALVKTGTAPCMHVKCGPGDGFVIVMLPAADPEILLLVRLHGSPGSHAAKVAGELLQRVEE